MKLFGILLHKKPPKAFYCFSERVDYEKECRKLGLSKTVKCAEIHNDEWAQNRRLTHKKRMEERCDCGEKVHNKNDSSSIVEEWHVGDNTFVRLNPWECHSVFSTILMRLPGPHFDALLDMALKSKDYMERCASLGVLLAKHEKLLIQDLRDQKILTKEYKRLMREIIHFINNLAPRDRESFDEFVAIAKNYGKNRK